MDLKLKLGDNKFLFISLVVGAILNFTHGCDIVDHLWIVPIQAEILDVHEGVVLMRDTTDITGINNAVYGEAILGGPYFDLSIENSQLVVRTNEAFKRYEEVEVEQRVAITLEVNCAGGTTRGGLFVWIDLIDTNNNSPTFLPSDEYEFVIMPPLPPGYLITGCYNDPIIARDIDLTTQRINFAIEDNPYFEIVYDAETSTVAKQFNAQLRTKALLRSLSEPLTLQITATDVDLTPGPPRTTTGVVRLVPDAQFQFPEELVFTQTFYLANYTDDHQLNLLETISLRQGFDEYVNFTLEGEHAAYFDLIEVEDENQLSIVVETHLPDEVISEGQILLIVNAQREYTSGASVTVIVQFPQGVALQFERAIYEGSIVNNSLQIPPLVLSQGQGEARISTEIFGEYSSYFTATAEEGVVTLTMEQLPAHVIVNNSFISLQVVAGVIGSSASTVVNLDIIKDDNVTPVFDQPIYSGNYDPVSGLSVVQIVFAQGFDETVSVELVGEHSDLFQVVENGPILTLSSSPIPAEMFSQRHILLSIVASKPRTVGANAAITIALPAAILFFLSGIVSGTYGAYSSLSALTARVLEFEESTYKGSVEGGELSLETINLDQGYEEDVTFNISGEHSTYFSTSNEQGHVTVVLPSALPDTVITQNNAILLTLTASGINAVTTTTNILLDVIKYDTITPIFARSIYTGTYSGHSIDIEAINLAQGFEDSVSFRLDGAHAEYFAVEQVGSNAVITLQYPILEDVILSEKVLVFNVFADKALTVGANAAVLIRFPTELTDLAIMEFSRNTYVGTLQENEIRLESIVLESGFENGTEFILSGDYADHFFLSNTASDNIKHLSSHNTLPADAMTNNSLIVLEIEARRPRAVSVWTSLILDVVKQEEIAPVFGQAFYTGAYSEQTGLTFGQDINLLQGFDETITFALSEDINDWFDLEQEGNSLSLVLKNPLPNDLIASNSNLLFTIFANKPSGVSGRAVIFIDLHTDSLLRFQEHLYKGFIQNGIITLEEIVLEEYTSEVNYTLIGDYTENFQLMNQNGTFTVQLETQIANDILEDTALFVFKLEAQSAFETANTIIVLENRRNQSIEGDQNIEFEKPYYLGTYSSSTDLQFDADIKLTTEVTNINFDVEGEDAEWFALERTDSAVTVTLRSTIPAAVLANNQQLVFVVTARNSATNTARTTVVIALTDSISDTPRILGFNQINYLGSIENNETNISIITLSEGHSQDVEFRLHGVLSDYFDLTPDGASVTIAIHDGIPQELIPSNSIIVLEIQASAPEAVMAYATIVFEYISEDIQTPGLELIFEQTFYSGSYAAATGLEFSTPISLTQGYDSNVVFDLEGDDAEWFALERTDSAVTVTLRSTIPAAVLANNQQLVFVVTARGPVTNTARATVVIALTDFISETPVILGFNQITYLGSIESNQANISIITLNQGYSQSVEFKLFGELSDYFDLTPDGASITVTLQDNIPQQLIPYNRIIVLEIQATAPEAVTAYATIIFEYITDDIATPDVELKFEQTFYNGSYAAATGLEFLTPISLAQGYESNVVFDLEGDDAEWFALERTDSAVTVMLRSTIPAAVLANNQQLVFVVTARGPATNTARATVLIALTDYTQPGLDVKFDKVLYEGTIQHGVVVHETITLVGFSGSSVELHGEHSSQFEVSLSSDEVTVTSSGSALIPDGVTHVALEIHAGTASAVLLIRVIQSDEPVPPTAPTVSFDSTSYAFQVDAYHTGLVGRVQATASNGEAVIYSLVLDDGLQNRLTVNSDGEMYLSLLVVSGLYNFEVAATTVSSSIRAAVPAHLSVESTPVCGDEHVMAPLIVLNVDEEEPHYDLMNVTRYDNCHFTLSNRWPLNQPWLYVDEKGLHATAIDREHESIAFMALSQVQVEVTLVCNDLIRTKRSLTSDALGPYDYGTNKWILTDNISFNAKRSLVNIIVNDINDNAPVFVGKENEPIVVGYPVPNLAERVLPRSLVELQATDADIGENAALVYWSSEPDLAVARTTGFVHLRDGAVLENGARLTVSVTDRNGLGLTGTIDIMVRLLDESYIAVVTVKNAFLDDEQTIISTLSDAVGYQIKILRSVVISSDAQASRKKRDDTSTEGASLQMYVYGLIASEPVSVEQLTTDISNIVTAPVIASSISLQDHLEGQEICVIAGRDTGLLVATIVLSVLLFILLALIAVWFFLRWRKNRNYDQFSDQNSIASRNVSEDGTSKPDFMPRLDIAELRKSERRLQEILDTPVEEVYVEPIRSKTDAIVNISDPTTASIVTIDKLKDADDVSDDEFGEVKIPRRKSVVTFNEIVEKIIHLEDTPDADDASSEPEIEVYKL